MARGKKKESALTPGEKLAQALVSAEEQPYKVPDNWCWCKLDAVVVITTGRKDANYGCYDGTYPFFTCASEPIKCNDYSFDGESLLLPGNGANVGQVFYYDGKFEAYQRTYVLQSKSQKTDLKYIYYHIRGFWQDYNKDKQYGSATNYIKLGNFFNYSIPVAPYYEQKRIVKRIEYLFAKLDEAKEKAQSVLDSFETRKAAILHKAFTGELTAKWREVHGKGISEWTSTHLKECCQIGSGGTPSRKNPEYYKGSIPWIKTGEIDWNEIDDAEEKISNAAIESSSAKLYEPGAVLVAMYGMGVTRGRAAILRVPAATNQAVCVLQPKGTLLNKYLFYYFMCNYWDIREQAVGGNQLNLSGTIIGKFQISIPTLEEQTEIVRILDSLFDKEQQAKEAAEAVLEKIDLLKKSILARAFRGELGTNDPNEVSACELLRKVL